MFSSCGTKTKELQVRDIELFGSIVYSDGEYGNDKYYYIEEFLAVEDGTYSITLKDGKLRLSIPVKLLKNFPKGELADAGEIVACLTDKNGNEIQNSQGSEIEMKLEDYTNLRRLLSWASINDVEYLDFTYTIFDNEKDILDSVSSFAVYMDISLKQTLSEKTEKPITNISKTKKNNTKNSSANIDALLDKYEKYVKEYTEKAKDSGILGAAFGAIEMSEKGLELTEELENCEEEMTAEQLARFMDLQAKVISSLL